MMKLVDAETVGAIDSAAMKDYGITGLQLMENAGRGVAEAVRKEAGVSGTPSNRRIAIVAGKGSNGGDGFVAARHLKNMGFDVIVFALTAIKEITGDAGANASSWLKMGGTVHTLLSSKDLGEHAVVFKHSSVIVDGIFGTGLNSPVKGFFAEVIGLVNGLNKKVVAIDIPSGIDATTGAVLGHAIKASCTATMAAPKIGLFVYPGRSYAGSVEIIDIGSPASLLESKKIRWNLVSHEDLRSILKPRKPDSHKGTYGHVLILAGSEGKTGAAYMSAMGAMRVGAGLTTIGLPESLNQAMEAKTAEVMTLCLPETRERTLGTAAFEPIIKAAAGKTAVVIGPGLGTAPETCILLDMLIRKLEVPVVIDADGLNSMAGQAAILRNARSPLVLTPHPGEMARLLQTTTSEVQADRIKAAQRLSDETGATVVFKGAATVTASPDGEVFINPTGNPGLSTAGTGDVLSGMIGGLIAQGYEPLDAAYSAVYIHGAAGDKVKDTAGAMGMMATDLLPEIPRILNSIISAGI